MSQKVTELETDFIRFWRRENESNSKLGLPEYNYGEARLIWEALSAIAQASYSYREMAS